MGFIEKNLAYCPALIQEQLEKHQPSTDILIEERKAKNGTVTALVQVCGKEFWIHSLINPSQEAERWTRKIEAQEHTVYLLFGFGFGYHAEKLLEKCRELSDYKVIAIEPCREIFKSAIINRDLTAVLANPHFHLIQATKEHELTARLAAVLPVADLLHKEIKILTIDSLYYNIDLYKEMVALTRNYINAVIVNRNTVLFRGSDWMRNNFINIKSILRSRPLASCYGKAADIPIVIVSAGPSLDKNIKLLKQVKGKAIIIAVGTALKAVLKQGIEPEFVFSVDAGPKQIAMFEGITVNETRLCYDPMVNPDVPKFFPNKMYVSWSQTALPWLKRVFGNVGFINGGPSVANYAFDFAVRLGGNPIILIGQDLALDKGRTHASDTIHEGKVAQSALVEVDGIDGNKVLTRRDFFSMLAWFQWEIEKLPACKKVIDATEGGARIIGTEVMSFQQAIDMYICEELPLKEILNDADTPLIGETINCSEFEKVIETTLNQCQIAQELAPKGIKYALDLHQCFLRDHLKTNRMKKIYDDIEQALTSLKALVEFIEAGYSIINNASQILLENAAYAKKLPELSYAQGRNIANGYQLYFEKIKELSVMLTEILNDLHKDVRGI